MNIHDKINILDNKLINSLKKLNTIYHHENDEIIKKETQGMIEIFIGYTVFLKELTTSLNNTNRPSYTKSFLKKQFDNIDDSCKVVDDFYKEIVNKS